MRKRILLFAGGALLTLLLICGGFAFWVFHSMDRDYDTCSQNSKTFIESVQDSRKWTDTDLPGVGDYLEVHWQGRPLSDPCGWIGPTDWSYRGVIQLRPADAKALAQRYAWYEHAGPDLWPALAEFVPSNAQWTRTDIALKWQYHGYLYLDREHDLLFLDLART